MSTKVRGIYQPSFSINQEPADQAREMIQQQVRGAALSMIQALLLEEVERLCGKSFSSQAYLDLSNLLERPKSFCTRKGERGSRAVELKLMPSPERNLVSHISVLAADSDSSA